MTKHTRGPWTATHEAGARFFLRGAGDTLILWGCSCCDSPCLGDNAEADARLIASAPDLLNALTVLERAARAFGIPTDAAQAAIARATGETP